MGSDQDVLIVSEAVYDSDRPAAVRASGRLDAIAAAVRPRATALVSEPEAAVARFSDGPVDDDLALLALHVRDDEVAWEHGWTSRS